MNELYEIINGLYPNYDNRKATIIEGKNFGETAVFSERKVVYESRQGLFSDEQLKNILENHLAGVFQLDEQRIYCERLASERKLVICGGGHVAIAIIKMSKMLGFHVTVIEDRVQYADNARRNEADEVICDDFSKALDNISGDLNTYFVIVTRGHRYDQACLEKIIQKENAYIGMMGSRVRVKKIKEFMKEQGYNENLIEKIHSPIGLNISAETPEEISVAIMAEIIMVKNQEKRSCGYSKEIMKAIFHEETKDIPKILATIVSRKGSAPREVGTKMLIYKDGTIVGTIGGGCIEADICRKAGYQFMEEDKASKIYTVDMTGRDAEEEGMVCGGVVEILLERIS